MGTQKFGALISPCAEEAKNKNNKQQTKQQQNQFQTVSSGCDAS